MLHGIAHGQQHAFRQFTTKDGLAQSQVRAMAQDGDGYLWFGTLGGASRFDGTFFQNLALQEGLPDAQVSAMIRDPNGTLWMGAGNFLVRTIGSRLISERLPDDGRNARIMGLASGPNGDLYIGTDGAGLFIRDVSGVHLVKGYPSDTATHVRSLLMLRDGSLLVGLRNGLLHCRDGQCAQVIVGDSEPKIISALAEAADGSWWVGTLGSGVYRIGKDGETKEYDEESGLLQNNIRCLLVDDQDHLWVGTKLGLNKIEGERIRVFTVHQGMPNDNIQCAFQDSEGNLWFGTDGAGVVRYLGDRFVIFTGKDGMCSDLVMSITTDAQGDLWLGTYDNGLCRMDGMAMITTLDGLPNNTVWCGALNADGTLWFGTSDGLARIHNGVVLRPKGAVPLAGSRVLSLLPATDGRMWCGTREGLALVGPADSVRLYPAGPTGPGRSIRSIKRVRDELVLASDDGLYLLKGDSFRRLGVEDGLCDNTVFCLLVDKLDRTWAGTANGLSCYDGERFHTFRFATDFGSNYIDLLLTDESGRIWAGTNNGLFQFHPDSLLSDHGDPIHITLNDGLRSLEFNLNAAYRTSNGGLLFGSSGGMVYHDPRNSSTERGPIVPRIHITDVRSFLQQTDWPGQMDSLDARGLPAGLHVSHRRHYLTFDYGAISLARPEQVMYRYRLVDYDPDWLPSTSARFASYNNLPHGEYTFQVMAHVGAGPWSNPAEFTFRIDPPFWSRWWFFALCALAVGGSLYGVHRYRSTRRERREHTRQLMLRSRMLQLEQQALNANMNRHFVFNALNSIQYHINKQDSTTASRYLTSFAKLIRKNLDASQTDTTTLTEELERLELYLVLEHMRFKDKFRYTITVDPSVDANQVRLPAMMLQPYVENSIWHGILPMSTQGHVAITVEPGNSADRVFVRIVDDGIGVDQSMRSKPEPEGDHISRGIEITKGRADVLRKLEVTDIRIDGPHQWHDPVTGRIMGTRVSIQLPIQPLLKKPV
ncbi:MAG: histidine kinase [Flavobacteriales bacterium]|nr:histidine kinase [Flavobacteriales bacterium]